MRQNIFETVFVFVYLHVCAKTPKYGFHSKVLQSKWSYSFPIKFSKESSYSAHVAAS